MVVVTLSCSDSRGLAGSDSTVESDGCPPESCITTFCLSAATAPGVASTSCSIVSGAASTASEGETDSNSGSAGATPEVESEVETTSGSDMLEMTVAASDAGTGSGSI